MSLQLPSGHFMLSLSFPSPPPQRAPARSRMPNPSLPTPKLDQLSVRRRRSFSLSTFCHPRSVPGYQRSGSIHSHLNQSASSCPGWLTSQTTSLSYFVLCIRGRVPVQHQHHQTFHQIPVLPSEQGFTATSVGANFFLLRVLIFGPAVRPQWGVASPHGSADPPTFKRTAAARPSSFDPRRPSLLIPNPKPPFAEPLRPAAPPLPFLRPTRRRAAINVTDPFRTPDTLCISLTPLAPRTRRAAASLQLIDSIITLPFGCCPDTCPQDDTEDLSEASIQIHVSSK